MPITPTEAADIAKRHGLTLQDAAGLLNLADDTAQAETIAGRFADNKPDPDLDARDFARTLFGKDDDTDDPPPRSAVHAYTRDLFRKAD